jgi:hypothetical protein
VSASLVLAIVGTVVAVIGLRLTGLEYRARRNADAGERENRTKEINLVRRQVAAIERQAELEESADIRVKRGGRDGLGWSFVLVNSGRATATSVKAWLVEVETGRPGTVTVELAGPLLPLESTEDRRLFVPIASELIERRTPLALMLSWVDSRERERRDAHPIDL